MCTESIWPVCKKSISENKNGTGAMTTAENEVLLGYNMKIVGSHVSHMKHMYVS